MSDDSGYQVANNALERIVKLQERIIELQEQLGVKDRIIALKDDEITRLYYLAYPPKGK